MYYTNLPYINEKDWFGRNTIRRLSKPVRINIRSLNKLPTPADLFIRNGSCVKYESGYWAPIKKSKFDSAQEVGKFLHMDGRNGLRYVAKRYYGWFVWECKWVATKVEAEKLAKLHGFNHAYRCSDGEGMLFN